jgi:hypothetical protein
MGLSSTQSALTAGKASFGLSLAAMESYRWSWTTVHVNEQVQYSRNGNLDLFGGLIAEGPAVAVRPVVELYWEREFHQSETWSALLGALWTFREWLVFDIGLRAARYNGTPEEEVRAGLTLTIPLWEPAENASAPPAPVQ